MPVRHLRQDLSRSDDEQLVRAGVVKQLASRNVVGIDLTQHS
jgi:hypothetical protein